MKPRDNRDNRDNRPPDALGAFVKGALAYLKKRDGELPRLARPGPPPGKLEAVHAWEAMVQARGAGKALLEAARNLAEGAGPIAQGALLVELGALIRQLQDVLQALAVKGNAQAARQLAGVALHAAEGLKEAARLKPGAVRPTSEGWGWWPVVSGPHPEQRAEAEELIRNLKVGAKAPENLQGRYRDKPTGGQPFRATLARHARKAFLLVQTVQHHRFELGLTVEEVEGALACKAPDTAPPWLAQAMELPAFNKASLPVVKEWFTVGWAALVEAGNGDARTLPGLAEVGEPREGVYQRATGNRGSKKATRKQGTEQLREQLLKAFLTRYYTPPRPAV